MERGVTWYQKNQFGIQLDKRVRGKWSLDWHKFVTNPISPKIESKNFLSDDTQIIKRTSSISSCQRGGKVGLF